MIQPPSPPPPYTARDWFGLTLLGTMLATGLPIAVQLLRHAGEWAGHWTGLLP